MMNTTSKKRNKEHTVDELEYAGISRERKPMSSLGGKLNPPNPWTPGCGDKPISETSMNSGFRETERRGGNEKGSEPALESRLLGEIEGDESIAVKVVVGRQVGEKKKRWGSWDEKPGVDRGPPI